METEIQTPIKHTLIGKDGKDDEQIVSPNNLGRMDPPALPSTLASPRSSDKSPDKNAAPTKQSGVQGSSNTPVKKTVGASLKSVQSPSRTSMMKAPTTSAVVGGPSLPCRSSVGSSNKDLSSFKTYR